MSLESFGGFDSAEPMSAASLEKLRERMRAAAAQMAAIKKEEGKQKKKEDELLKILLAFIQHSHKSALILLISRVLAINVPASFILAVILLGNEEIQKSVGKRLAPAETAQPDAKASDGALVFFQEDKTIPLKVRIEMDNWLKNMMFQAEENPHKLLKTSYKVVAVETGEGTSSEKQIQEPLIDLMAHILNEFLTSNGQNDHSVKVEEFCHFLLKGVLTKTQEGLDNRKHVTGEQAEDL